MAAELRSSDLGLGQLFRIMREAVVAADAETGRIVLWNPAAEALFGYAAEEALGLSIEAIVPERLKARHRAGLAGFRSTGKGNIIDSLTAVELPAVRKTGEEIVVELTLNRVVDATVEGCFVVAIIRDVTDRKRAEEERAQLVQERAARAEAEANVAVRDEFFSVAAHELKTPITSLRLLVQILLAQFSKGAEVDPPQLQRALSTVDQQSAKLTQLVIKLLERVRLEAGRLVLERKVEDLTQLVARVVDLVQATTTQHELAFLAPPQVLAKIDALRMEQVVGNLLDNAIKYSPEGGRVDVDLSAVDGETVSLAVRDRGIGVPPEHRPRIFERFYQAHANSHRSGLGLGLYIARRIVELHGGRLEVEFLDDGGTRFVITLPTGLGAVPAGRERVGAP